MQPVLAVIFHTRLHGWPLVLEVVQASVEHWFFLTPLHTKGGSGVGAESTHVRAPARWPCQMLRGKLYDFAWYGCRSEETVGRLLETFADPHLPLGFLSQTGNQ